MISRARSFCCARALCTRWRWESLQIGGFVDINTRRDGQLRQQHRRTTAAAGAPHQTAAHPPLRRSAAAAVAVAAAVAAAAAAVAVAVPTTAFPSARPPMWLRAHLRALYTLLRTSARMPHVSNSGPCRWVAFPHITCERGYGRTGARTGPGGTAAEIV